MEIAIGAFANALGMRIYQKESWLHKTLGVCLMTYGLGGAILWFATYQRLL